MAEFEDILYCGASHFQFHGSWGVEAKFLQIENTAEIAGCDTPISRESS